MKIIFMGTPDFSVPTLNTLIHSKHEVLAVVSQPDRPKGRGNKISFTPVKQLALENNIKIYQPLKIKEEGFINTLKEMNPDVIVVIAFGQILPKTILEIPKFGCINIHASLLPKYRGAAPIQWAVINGEKTTGLTTMFMDTGLDTGDMLLKEIIEINDEETGGSLHDRLSQMGGELILKTLDALEDGNIIRTPQDNTIATYAPMLDKTLGYIDWNKSAKEIERLIRGLNPWPSAYTYYNDKILKIWDAEVITDSKKIFSPGTICDIIKEGFIVKCGENSLLINELQLQGKNRMDTPSFLRGVSLEKGYSFM